MSMSLSAKRTDIVIDRETVPAASPEVEKQVREKIAEIQDFMLTQGNKELPLKHYFAEGVYAREIFIPKGVMWSGKYTDTNT